MFLIETEVSRRANTTNVDVFVDTERGVSADELAMFNRRLSARIEEEFPDEHALEVTVSSPGLERPLTAPWQFRRHTGREIEIELHDENGTRAVLAGRIVEADATGVVVENREGRREIPYERIVSAYVRVSFH